MPLSTEDLDYVRKFVRAQAAIVLDEKDYLIESRLTVLAEREGYGSTEKLVQTARLRGQGSSVSNKIIDALTTNETLFFRDVHPFTGLQQKIIQELVERNAASKRLRIWCAACSTGQEPYSMAMLIKTHYPVLETWRIEITATDLSPTVLERARAGCFNQTEMNRGLPAAMMLRFFEQDDSMWRIDQSIRKMVNFRQLNLIQSWPHEEPFDLVSIRNVMIYFDLDTRREILRRISTRLTPSGYLMLGSAESPIGLSDAFVPVQVGKTVFFKKK